MLTILFSYSSWPLRVTAMGGFAVAGLSFLLGGFYLLSAFWRDTQVEGWTTLVVLVAVFSGLIIAMLSMIGEYVVRTLDAVSTLESFHVAEKVTG